MTDNEIVKALECCGDEQELKWCVDCPYYNKENDLCQEDLHRDALDLINRQNEQLQANSDSRQTNEFKNIDVARFEAEINRLQAENERLKKEVAYWETEIKEARADIDQAVTEAYKECVEKVKEIDLYQFIEEYYQNAELRYEVRRDWFDEHIDNLLKELVGDK